LALSAQVTSTWISAPFAHSTHAESVSSALNSEPNRATPWSFQPFASAKRPPPPTSGVAIESACPSRSCLTPPSAAEAQKPGLAGIPPLRRQ
jgi:hypothetical protein